MTRDEFIEIATRIKSDLNRPSSRSAFGVLVLGMRTSHAARVYGCNRSTARDAVKRYSQAANITVKA